MSNIKDQDREKGALEQDERRQAGNTSMQGQLGHRDQDPMLKAADTDFPEPGEKGVCFFPCGLSIRAAFGR